MDSFSHLVDCSQSQNQNSSPRMLQSALDKRVTKSGDQKTLCSKDNFHEISDEVQCFLGADRTTLLGDEHDGQGDKVQSSIMEAVKHDNSAISNAKCFASDYSLTVASSLSGNDVASTNSLNETMHSDKEANENVEPGSEEISADKRPEGFELGSDSNVCKEKKPDGIISEGWEKLHSDAAVAAAERGHSDSSSRARSENEDVIERKDADLPSLSYDISLPVDLKIESEQRVQTSGEQKNKKVEAKQKPDSLRAVGRLLNDLGLDLVREQVYKDLIGIQVVKEDKNMLDEKEREQLKRLTDAHSKLLVKNTAYQLPSVSCRCNYASSSVNVLALHHEFGSASETPFHSCCLCEDYKTRWSSQFLAHLECSHQIKGRLYTKQAPNTCRWCSYEHKNQARMEAHTGRCLKMFNLSTNLQPLPADCDMPLMGKTSQLTSSQSLRPGGTMIGPSGLSSSPAGHGGLQMSKPVVNPATPSNVQPLVMEIGGQLYSLVHHNGKALFTSLRSQIANVSVSNHCSSALSSAMVPGEFSRFVQPLVRPVAGDCASDASARRVPFSERCEMCDAVVKNRDALWNHFRLLHKVELSRVSMTEKEPWMTCDVCSAKFWTYQGLTRHSVQLHKRETNSHGLPTKASKCFLCLQTQTNPLSHLSTFHNITLLDMYHSLRCCMCNKRFRAAPAFEEHMVLQHHDIFANKDVLSTVLQALSTALRLKRQDLIQHRPPPTQASSQSCTGFNTVASGANVRSTGGLVPQPFQKVSPQAHLPGRMLPPDKPVSRMLAAPPGQTEAKKRARQSNERSKSDECAAKTPQKNSNEQDAKELNQIYSEYADIGRPILRSMRHRLSQNSLDKSVDDNPQESAAEALHNDAKGSVKSTQETITESSQKSVAEANLSTEPLRKRLCTDSSSNNTKRTDAFHVIQQGQELDTNGDDANSTKCQKTS